MKVIISALLFLLASLTASPDSAVHNPEQVCTVQWPTLELWPVFTWPLADLGGVRISQGYHERHRALDLAGPLSTPVVAAAPGLVRFAGWYDDAYGNLVVIDHPCAPWRRSPRSTCPAQVCPLRKCRCDGGYSSWYAHLEQVDVAIAERVHAGQVLGIMGETGRATGIHLHFEIRHHNCCQNPTLFLNTKEIP